MGLGDGFGDPAFGGIVRLLVEPTSIPSANSLIGVARWSSWGRLYPSLAAFLLLAASARRPSSLIEAGSF